MSIDTRLDATPSDIATSAETVGDIKTNVDSAEDDLISARKIIAGDPSKIGRASCRERV